MSSRDLDNYEYDEHLAKESRRSRGARRELEQRHTERKNKGYSGWHFGLGDRPVKIKDKEEFKRELDKRNLIARDDVHKELR